ncbi:MAG: ArsA family ATPase [Myxococcales bacterium]|nr:ArsA family ATPase [Myxococcales bacterium]
MTRVIITCGSGGVGKTTISAALALRLAEDGNRVVVLTIDPAMRLADALGLKGLDNQPQRVPTERGELLALMLDPKQTFDELVARHAPSAEVRDRILDNHYYRSVSTHLPGVHEYMAMEKLLALYREADADVIVLDTPPTRHALDFLVAPERMSGLMDEGVMRWIVLPASVGGWRMLEMGSDVLAGVLKRLLGEQTVGEIAEFFAAFQGLWGGFRERSSAVRALLRAPGTRFLLVTAPAPGARVEALAFLAVLQKEGMPFAGFLVNRCAAAAPGPLSLPAAAPGDEARWDALGAALEGVLARHRALVATQDAAVDELVAFAPRGALAWRVPEAEGDVHDLAGLRLLGRALTDSGAVRGLDTP